MQSAFDRICFYRLNVIELAMPPLRDRDGDVAELAELMLERIAADYGADKPELTSEALAELEGYSFPGNVRELENILERASTLCEDNRITAADLNLNAASGVTQNRPPAVAQSSAPDEEPSLDGTSGEPVATSSASEAGASSASGELTLSPGESLEGYLEKIERQLITAALERTRWNKTAAAKELGITFRAPALPPEETRAGVAASLDSSLSGSRLAAKNLELKSRRQHRPLPTLLLATRQRLALTRQQDWGHAWRDLAGTSHWPDRGHRSSAQSLCQACSTGCCTAGRQLPLTRCWGRCKQQGTQR